MKTDVILGESVVLEGMTDEIVKKYNITKRGPSSTGLDEKKGIWYGWSHRALCGFKVGDKLFDPKYVPAGKTEEDMDTVPFVERGKKTCKTLDDAQQAAVNFSKYVS